jgi:hypothetical protein
MKLFKIQKKSQNNIILCKKERRNAHFHIISFTTSALSLDWFSFNFHLIL